MTSDPAKTVCHKVANIATAAAAMTAAVIQPSHFNKGGLARLPMIFRLLVNITTNTINGGASTPFRTADQNSILTAARRNFPGGVLTRFL